VRAHLESSSGELFWRALSETSSSLPAASQQPLSGLPTTSQLPPSDLLAASQQPPSDLPAASHQTPIRLRKVRNVCLLVFELQALRQHSPNVSLSDLLCFRLVFLHFRFASVLPVSHLSVVLEQPILLMSLIVFPITLAF
jgi:hypothetical protein